MIYDGGWFSCPNCKCNLISVEQAMMHKCPKEPPQLGNKHDKDKPRMDLLPMDALLEIAKVLTQGAKKYGDRNWEKGLNTQRLRAAYLRHDAAEEMGEEMDSEFGLRHAAHKACDSLMELALKLRRKNGN